MVTIVRTFFLTLLLAFPLNATAQSDETTPAPAAEEPTNDAANDTQAADGNASTAGELSLGTPESGEPQVGQTYISEEHGDWQLRCVKTEDGKDPCQLYQLLNDSDGNSVAEINIFNLPEGQEAAAGATVVTPLETLLTAQLRLAVDTADPKRYPYSFCSRIGCFARLGFTDAEIEGFKRGAKATVTLVPAAAPDDRVDLTVSLSGFTAGWNAVVAANAE